MVPTSALRIPCHQVRVGAYSRRILRCRRPGITGSAYGTRSSCRTLSTTMRWRFRRSQSPLPRGWCLRHLLPGRRGECIPAGVSRALFERDFCKKIFARSWSPKNRAPGSDRRTWRAAAHRNCSVNSLLRHLYSPPLAQFIPLTADLYCCILSVKYRSGLGAGGLDRFLVPRQTAPEYKTGHCPFHPLARRSAFPRLSPLISGPRLMSPGANNSDNLSLLPNPQLPASKVLPRFDSFETVELLSLLPPSIFFLARAKNSAAGWATQVEAVSPTQRSAIHRPLRSHRRNELRWMRTAGLPGFPTGGPALKHSRNCPKLLAEWRLRRMLTPLAVAGCGDRLHFGSRFPDTCRGNANTNCQSRVVLGPAFGHCAANRPCHGPYRIVILPNVRGCIHEISPE